jgi:hypothetical protein
MNHLQLFESFKNNRLIEVRTTPKSSYSNIPVYNEVIFMKNIKLPPEKNIKSSEVIETVRELLSLKSNGKIKKVTVVAEIPTQGKGTPEYIREFIKKERERLAALYFKRTGKEVDPHSKEFEKELDRYGNERTIFFDSEFIIDRINKIGPKEFLIGIPFSLQKHGFEAAISPDRVEEIFYTPSNS